MKEFAVEVRTLSIVYCNNLVGIHIGSNPVFCERTKHIEVDCHFIIEIIASKEVITPYIESEDQIGDIFTKAVHKGIFVPSYLHLSGPIV